MKRKKVGKWQWEILWRILKIVQLSQSLVS